MSLDILIFTKVSLVLSHPPSFRKSNVQIKMCWCFSLFNCFFSKLCFLFYFLLSSFLGTEGSRINLWKGLMSKQVFLMCFNI